MSAETEAWEAWKAETDLVADFSDHATKCGWVVYAETAGWDLLLVRPADGFQIGVEAKLSLNATVLCQILSRETSYGRGVGPDCRAALVPAKKTVNGLTTIARHLGIVVIEGHEPDRWNKARAPNFSPGLPDEKHAWSRSELGHGEWPELCPDQRHALPDYVPDVVGGKAAPVALTQWKIKALKVVVTIEAAGAVTRADFKALGIDPSRWTQYWLKSNGEGGWVPKPTTPDFKAQHPVNYEQIKADIAKWGPLVPSLAALGEPS